jgi:hypothetical protein
MFTVRPFRLLVPVVVACLLLVGARDSRGAVPVRAADLANSYAPLIPAYFLYHPRFYKEYGSDGLNSTLYVQNPQMAPVAVQPDFYDCDSGVRVSMSPWFMDPLTTKAVTPEDLPGLAPGCYGLVLVSDGNLAYASVVEDRWGGPAIDRLATHRGFTRDEPSSSLRFGPFLKGDVNSTVHIWNISNTGTGAVTAGAYSELGSPIDLDLPACTVGPYAQCTYDASDLPGLTAPFTGTLAINSTGGTFVGIMALSSAAGDVNEYRTPLEANAADACLPRVLKHVNEGGSMRSTSVFVANSGAEAADVALEFYDSDGKPVEKASKDFTLAGNGSRYLSLADLDTLPKGTWSACARGDRPLALEELTQIDSPFALLASSGTHGVTGLASSDMLAVTHLMRSDASYTAFSVQNTGIITASVDLKYYDVAGALVHADSVNLAPMGWVRFDQSTQSGLENGFVGSPVVSSNQPLVSLVDVYTSPRRVYLPFALR